MSFELNISAKPHSIENTEILSAFLFSLDCEGVVEGEGNILAYFKEAPKDLASNLQVLDFPTEINSSTKMKEVNWNTEWEKNYFKPLVINDIGIRSTFHPLFDNIKYEIIIDPKMSFGTGHHQTTSMMLDLMSSLDFNNKTVIDMGTGTGILAIHALQKNAKKVHAIDFDIWSVNNSIENAKTNNVNFNIIHGDASALANLPKADIFLANINREVLLRDISKYTVNMKPQSYLLLSGFFKTEIDMIVNKGKESNLNFINSIYKKEWACVLMQLN